MIKRDTVTPYLTSIFLIVGLSGLLMFFHLLDNYTNIVHEFLGLTFVLFALLHEINNWKSLRNYFENKRFIIPGIVILFVSISVKNQKSPEEIIELIFH